MARPAAERPRLGEVLVASGLLTRDELEQALARSQRRGLRLGEVLVQEGVLTQDQINWALARHFGLAYVDVRGDALDRELIRSLRTGLLYQHKIVPLVRLGDTITLAMADPTDSDAVLEVSDTTGCDVECAIASEEAVLAALDTVFSPEERRTALAGGPAGDQFARMAVYRVPRQRLGEILVDALLLSEEQLHAALARQKGTNLRLGELLIREGTLTEDQINWALARHLDVPYIHLTQDMVDPELVDLVPFGFLRAHLVVPLMRVDGRLVLAMVDPLDHGAIAEAARASGCDVVVSIAPRRDVEAVLARLAHGWGAARGRAASVGIDGEAAAPTAAGRGPAPLPPESVAAFKETIQQSGLPLDEKIKVYQTVQAIVRARQRGGPSAERAERKRGFASLAPAAMKLALQLYHQIGNRDVPPLRDEDFQARHGRAGSLHPTDRRFIVDRRAYDRTVREFAQRYKLEPAHIENAVMAARAYMVTDGDRQILLASEGERRLAEALTRIIRVAHTREHPATAQPGAYGGPERRATAADVQKQMDAALGESRLDPVRRAKVVRAFRLLHRSLEGVYDRQKVKELIRQGIFVGFSGDEIALVERILKIHGYQLS